MKNEKILSNKSSVEVLSLCDGDKEEIGMCLWFHILLMETHGVRVQVNYGCMQELALHVFEHVFSAREHE